MTTREKVIKSLKIHQNSFKKRASALIDFNVELQDALVEKESRYIEGVCSILKKEDKYEILYKYRNFLEKFYN